MYDDVRMAVDDAKSVCQSLLSRSFLSQSHAFLSFFFPSISELQAHPFVFLLSVSITQTATHYTALDSIMYWYIADLSPLPHLGPEHPVLEHGHRF